MSASKPVIIIKKNGRHGGHHGGAWKVAYADFVTALMSLFIVLWLMNTSEKVRQAVAGYFNDPRGKSTMTGSDQTGTSDSLAVTEKNIPELKKKIEEAIRKMNDLKALQNQIQITITPEGLRIELLETKDGTFFRYGQRAAEQEWAGAAGDVVRAAGRVAESSVDRGTHGCAAVCVEGRVRELGAIDGPGERGAAGDADFGAAAGSGVASEGVCGPETAGAVESHGSVEPEDFADRAVSDGRCATGCGGQAVGEGGKPAGEGGKPASGAPTLEIPAPGSGTQKPGAAAGGDAKSGDAKGDASPPAPSATQPGGAQSAAKSGSDQAPQNAAKTVSVQKPSAAKPVAGNAVSRLWQKIHSK
jgi:hypothetical protein